MPETQLTQKLSQVSAYQQAVVASSVLSITDTEGVITYVNDHFCALSQYSSAELIGNTHRIISSRYHGKAFFQNMFDTISAGKVWRGDVKNRAKDGSTYWVDMTIVPLKNEKGNIDGYVAIDYDITDRKLVKERRFKLLFDNSKDGLLMARPNGAFSEINDAFCAMLGYTREELLKMKREDLTVPDDANLSEGLKKRKETGHYEGMLKFRRKDGSIIEANISSAIYEDDNGEQRSYICVRDMTERVQAEEDLRAHKNRLRSMIEHGKDVITLIDGYGSVKYRSPSYKTVFGYDPDSMGDDLVFGNLHPDDQQSVKVLMTELMKKPGSKIDTQWRQKHSNGHYMWMEGSGTNMLDDPEMQAIVLNCRDISEHIRIKEELEKNNKELNRLFNSIDDVLYSTERSPDKQLQWSDSCLKVYGYTAEEFMANPMLWYEVIVPEDKQVIHDMNKVLEAGQIAKGECRIVHKDGSIRFLEANITPTLDEHGVLKRIDGINRDITEKKNAENIRIKAEKRFRELIENSKDGIALSTKDRKFTYVSPAVREILGYEPKELIGMNTYDYFHPEEQIKTQEFYINLLGKSSFIPPLVLRARHKDGTMRIIELTANNKLDDPAINAIVTNFRDVTDRINAEQARIDSEKRFQALIENSKDVIALTDRERKIVYMSPAVKGVLGYDWQELIGKSAYDILMDPEEVHKNIAFRGTITPGQTFTRVTKARHKDGSWRWVESEITNYLDDPTINGMLTNFRDVTEKQAAKEALHQSERKFRALIENSKDIIALGDADNKILYVSPAIKDILGYEPEELVGTETYAIVHPDEVDYTMAVRRRIEPGQTMTTLMRAHHKNGSWRWLEVTLTNQLDNPSVNAFVSNIRDVTEKKGAEEALINSEKKFRALIENNKDGIALTDSNREFIYLSPSMTDILGYTSSELIGTQATDLYHPEDLIEMEKKVSPFILHRHDHLSGLVRIRHKDGKWRWVELTSSNKLDDPAINAIVTNFRDVTARKSAEEAVQNSERRFRALIKTTKKV
jgi:PAS domain S-box-containing protein